MAVQFGVETDDPGTYGIIQNFERTLDGEWATYRNASGDTAGVKQHDENITITGTYVYNGDATLPPAFGTVITINQVKYYLQQVRDIESNDDFRRTEITAIRYTPNALPAN